MIIPHGVNWSGHDLAGWLVSEKFDGVRAVWDGSDLYRRARTGNGLGQRIEIPAEWRHALTGCAPFDSELWCGRRRFRDAVNLAVYGKGDWNNATLMVFDSLGEGTFRERAKRLGGLPLICGLVGHKLVRSTVEAMSLAQSIWNRGGEGIVALHPAHTIHTGRSDRIVKIKAEQLANWEARSYFPITTSSSNRLNRSFRLPSSRSHEPKKSSGCV